MNISATNCTPIKPQVASFKGDRSLKFEDEQFDSFMELSDKLDGEFVHSDNIKKPMAVIASIALAGLTAFVFGGKIVSLVRRAFPEFTNPDSAKYFENYIKKGANKVSKFATNLQEGTGKGAKIKKFVGNTIIKAEDIAKNAYKKITNIGTKNVPQNPGDIAGKKLENLGGAISTAVFVPSALKADANEDGVADISQRGQNAYTGTKQEINKSVEKFNILGDIVDLLT